MTLVERVVLIRELRELADFLDEQEKLKADNARLREALLRYGDHDSECYVDQGKPCACGLDAALKETKP